MKVINGENKGHKYKIPTIENIIDSVNESLEAEDVHGSGLNFVKMRTYEKLQELVKKLFINHRNTEILIDEPSSEFDYVVVEVRTKSISVAEERLMEFNEVVSMCDMYVVDHCKEYTTISFFVVDIWDNIDKKN